MPVNLLSASGLGRLLRPRRRNLATVGAEVCDGIVPASETIAQTSDLAGGAPRTANYRTVALIVATALFMEHLDATVLATALPTMARDFHVGVTELSVALTAYLLALAVFVPASGFVADKFGSRTVFQVAIGLFTLSSIACGLAPNLPTLVLARFIQGVGGAMMMPVGRLVLLRAVAKEDLVSAMQWLLMPALIGPIIGPPLGGLIVTYLDWRWIFWLNVPMGIAGVALVARFITDTREAITHRFDTLGFVLSSICLGCMLAGFEIVSRGGLAWAGPVFAVSLVFGGLYLWHERRTEHAILDTSLMRIPTFGLSVVGGSLTRITQGAQPFLLPLMMQLAFGFTAARSGAITVATTIGSFAMKAFAKRLLRRYGFRTSLTAMGVLGTLAYAVCGFFRPNWSMLAVFAVLTVSGFLMSFQFTAYNTLAYDEIDKSRMSSAISFYTTFQQLMLSLGICVGALALQVSMAFTHRHEPGFADFSAAFWTVTAISLTAVVFNLRFKPDAGADLSGHR
jgi:EmrB/QacA subfamily drug resistance transporter